MNIDKKTILIVEDDRSLLRALADTFQMEGYNVLDAINGKEGLKIALKEQPDVILLDLLMPVMDGMAFFDKLRQENEWGKQVPVVVLTNVEMSNDIVEIIAKNKPAYYLVKSDHDMQSIVDKVDSCFKQIRFWEKDTK